MGARGPDEMEPHRRAGGDASAPAAPSAPSSDIALFGIVAHEMRSPIAAILGYEELLSEGLLGSVDERAREALARIRNSARQLLTLTEGMQELSGRGGVTPRREDVDYAALLRAGVERATSEAEARRVTLDLARMPAGPVHGRSDAPVLENLLDAMFGAALKASTGRTLAPELGDEPDRVIYRIRNTALDPDILDAGRIDSGAALRIRIARRMTERLGGSIRLVAEDGGASLDVLLPR